MRRFDIERTFRMLEQTLGWTSGELRNPAAADRWTWLRLAAVPGYASPGHWSLISKSNRAAGSGWHIRQAIRPADHLPNGSGDRISRS